LLAFARKEVIKPRILNLNETVTGVQQLLTRTLGEHIEFRTDLAPDLRPVRADPGQIEQFLINLAVNSRDATPAGGQLAIKTANLTVDHTPSDGVVFMSGYTQGQLDTQGVLESGIHLIEKPLDPRDLLRTLHDVVSQK
jgi:signal transduction histidine kinase